MLKVNLGNTGLSVSTVGMGVLPIGPGQLALPLEDGAEIICHAVKKGINFIDTAQYYRTYPYKEGAGNSQYFPGGRPQSRRKPHHLLQIPCP